MTAGAFGGAKRAARMVVHRKLDQQNQFLLIHTIKDDRNRWEVPGGKIEEHESSLLAAQRELTEETGLIPAMTPLFLYQTIPYWMDGDLWTVDFYLCTLWYGDPQVKEKDRANYINWFTLEKMDELATLPALSVRPCEYALRFDQAKVEYQWPRSVPPDQKDDFFIQGMLNRMAVGFHNYGHMRRKHDRPDNIKNILIRLIRYAGVGRVLQAIEELKGKIDSQGTGNTEWLIDAGNYCMMEFAVPSIEGASFRATERDESPGSQVAGRLIKGKDELEPQHRVRQREGD